MKKILFMLLLIVTLSLAACNIDNSPVEEKPSEEATEKTPTKEENIPEVGPTKQYSTDLFTNEEYTYHVVGGYAQDWEPLEINTMKAVSIADVALYSTEVADYLTEMNEKYTKKDKPGIKALYMIEDYVLDNQPENASFSPALVLNDNGETELKALNQGYAVKCIRAYYDDVDETYINDRWISDPRVAHTETLTPDTLFMPKWVETPKEGEEHLGKWDDNPMCITGAGLYTVLIVEYNVVGNATTAGFGLALFKIASLVETPMPKN